MLHKSTRRLWLIALLPALGILILASAFVWIKRSDVQRSLERASLPTAVPYHALPLTSPRPSTLQPQPTTIPLPPEVNLAVPFTVQAPHANWEPPYGEFCEEASIFMAMSYIQNQAIPNPEFADQKLLDLWQFEHNTLHYPEDVTIAETARIIGEYYDYTQTEVIENPTAQDIKQAVAQGKLVIVPAAGRLLGNPYYQQPGPLYHMFVVKGYTTDGKFIVNDPGTRRGADFLFTESVLMNALHDWRTDHQIEQGKKTVLVVG